MLRNIYWQLKLLFDFPPLPKVKWFPVVTFIFFMTFTNHDYFGEVVMGIRGFDSEVRVFCLKASLNTVKTRLTQRGTKIEGTGSEWIARRIVECADAHRDSYFGEPVDTECRSAHDVAGDIALRLQQPL